MIVTSEAHICLQSDMNETPLHHGCSNMFLAALPCESKCFPPSDYFDISKINHHSLIHDFTNNIQRENEREIYM
ncbi:hypothetical protein ACOSP7_022926 [Xanthoceras sorbifolium]